VDVDALTEQHEAGEREDKSDEATRHQFYSVIASSQRSSQ
jgi:hypothetical protein